jgi:hypothetical protein
MPSARSATAAVLLGAAAGCGAGAEPAPVLMEIVPIAAYNEATVPVTIYGRSFRPSYAFDTSSGTAAVTTGGYSASLTSSDGGAPADLTAVRWESGQLLGGQIPAGLAAGSYDLVVHDPSGHVSQLAGAFQSLGADLTAPFVTIASPGSAGVVAASASVPVVVSANDGAGYGQLQSLAVAVTSEGLTVASPTCQVTGSATVSCAFTFEAPAPGPSQTLVIAATAVGAGGQVGSTQLSLVLVPAPTLTAVSPAAGSTLGGQTVALQGTGFLSSATEVTFAGASAEIVQQTSTSLTVVVPPQTLPGPAVVMVAVGGVGATLPTPFKYVAPPGVRELDPSFGPAAGLFPVTVVGVNFALQTTHVFFGGSPLLCPQFVNANRIAGLAPPGAGTEAVTASDDVGGAMPGAPVPFDYQGGSLVAPDGGIRPTVVIPDGGCPAGDGGP